ncbi:T9SS type A sorting domain-containing protein [uncultured Aquimarina sp.]|uniref:T9SS type A sorting domain-containing protein n=1 Tax=uncultured Aquimarina sp. TaxID=575652 RepID=UPI00260CD3C8|nr:T9SS type A sorting domain-containing protein [uncultured Aquimarina sp.]
MKTKLFFKITTILILINQLSVLNSFAQEVPFTPPLNNSSNLTLKGDMKIIANAVTGLSGDQSGTGNSFFSGDTTNYNPNNPYNGGSFNDRLTQNYIDIDNDGTTFSSSSADFISGADCPKVAYAGLYWSATYYIDRVDAANGNNSPQLDNLPLVDSRPDFRAVKLKLPGTSNYIDVNAESGGNGVIYDGYRNTVTNPNDIASKDISYVCYADVTAELKALTNPDGTYTVANVRSATGLTSSDNGISSGWVMVIIYEDPSLSRKQFSTQHGFLEINAENSSETFEYTGFQTPPAPNPVNAKFGIATLEGDFGIPGDGLAINAAPLGGLPIPLSADPVNGATNFFNSSISVDGAYNTARNPASENTLGFDADMFNLPNVGNTIIGNNQSSVEFVASTEGDLYRVFLNTFSIEVVEPELTGYTRVLDVDGIDITGGDLQFGQEFFYDFIIQNTGNENLTSVSVVASIADNIDFVQGSSITPEGVTAIYNDANREVVFTFDDSSVERLDPELTFRFGVRVVDSCRDLRDACRGDIVNTFLVSYTGQSSGIVAFDTTLSEPASCSFTLPAPPNFLDTSGDCNQEFSTLICSGTIDIVAESGFPQYVWTDLSTNTIIGNSQIISVSAAGLYKVDKTGNPDCLDQTEIWTVNDFGSVENPVIAIANDPLVNGNIRTCPITGDLLPELFLCGAGDEQYLDSGFVNTTSIVWERLDPAACSTVVRDQDCPTLDSTCDPDWVQVATTRDFIVTEAGEYRIRVEFDGGCIQDFYFKIFINDYAVNAVVIRDIVCDSEGIIRVTNPSLDYEYQLVRPQGETTPYQVSPEFTGLVEEGVYEIIARQNNGLPTACIFQSNVVLNRTDPLISVNAIQPICFGDLGGINITVVEGNPSYVFNISSATTPFDISSGSVTSPDFIFNALDIGTYNIEVLSNDEACVFTETVTISAPIPITADVAITREYICSSGGIQFGEITVMNPTGGNGSYEYSLDGIDFSNTIGIFTGLTSGTYSVFIRDTDTVACPINIGAVTIDPIQEITIDSIITTDGLCSGDTGLVTFVVDGIDLTAETYTYELTADNSVPIIDNNVTSNTITIPNLIAGVYNLSVTNDNTGCSYDDNFVILETSPIVTDINFIEEIGCDSAEAQVGLVASGGIPPYVFSLDNMNYFPSNADASSFIFTFTEGGTYILFVRDSNGCVAATNVTVNEVPQIDVVLDLSGTQIICFGGSTAVINSMVTGGSGFYSYAITGTDYLGSTVSVDPQTTSTFSGLLAGEYVYEVISEACSKSVPFTIVQPAEFIVSVEQEDVTTCNGIENGSITVLATGGNAPYLYSLYDGGNNPLSVFIEDDIDGIAGQHVFDSLVPGTYRVEIEDINGCPETVLDIVISQSVVDIALSVTPVSINDDGAIEVTASGGIGGYTYELLDATGDSVIIPSQNSNILIVNTAGDYIVKVIDSNGCFYFKEVTVETTEDNPIVDYADEILFCAITGQSYPVISIEDENGEVVDLSFTNVVSIIWQQLDEINCNVSFEENCPTTDDSCSSDWFDFQTGSSCTITESGQYRVVITFNTRSRQSTKIYYFRADANLLGIEDVLTSKINLYPNPANTIVNINTEVKSISVFDISGKVVLETTQKTFDISRLENGVYFTEVETIKGDKKIIKMLKE